MLDGAQEDEEGMQGKFLPLQGNCAYWGIIFSYMNSMALGLKYFKYWKGHSVISRLQEALVVSFKFIIFRVIMAKSLITLSEMYRLYVEGLNIVLFSHQIDIKKMTYVYAYESFWHELQELNSFVLYLVNCKINVFFFPIKNTL